MSAQPSPVSLPRVSILGAGSMGGAILSGLVAPHVSVNGGISVTNRTRDKAGAIDLPGVESLALADTPDANARALAGARLVIVAVKPVMVVDLLTDVRDALEPGAVIVSVAAGVTTATMEALVPQVVLRAMPNTPSTIGMGVTGVSPGSRGGADELELVERLFGTVGDVVTVPEPQLDALSTISGSGPAYVYFLIERFEQTARDLGFNAEQARVLVQGTFRGASELLVRSGIEPSELRRRVTSPNGTTERAIDVLEDARLSEIFDRATAAALARARELAD